MLWRSMSKPFASGLLLIDQLRKEETSSRKMIAKAAPTAKSKACPLPSSPAAVSGTFLYSDAKNQIKAPDMNNAPSTRETRLEKSIRP